VEPSLGEIDHALDYIFAEVVQKFKFVTVSLISKSNINVAVYDRMAAP
jgi:hypothetical protein